MRKPEPLVNSPTKALILAHLSHEALYASQIARKIGINPASVGEHLFVLEKEGYVHKTVALNSVAYTVNWDKLIDDVFAEQARRLEILKPQLDLNEYNDLKDSLQKAKKSDHVRSKVKFVAQSVLKREIDSSPRAISPLVTLYSEFILAVLISANTLGKNINRDKELDSFIDIVSKIRQFLVVD